MNKSKNKKTLKGFVLWVTTEHYSDAELCQAVDTVDFKLACVKMILRKYC